MAATTQEEILSGILPRISIEKINLSNVSKNLEITIELNIKEVLDNNFFGSWFDDINIKKYIIIDVIQSIDPSITEALSFSNDMIQLCNLSRSKKNQDTKVKAFSYLTGKKKLSELLELLEKKTKRNTISLIHPEKQSENIKNYPSYTNSDGEKVYEITYKTKFTLNNIIEPEHLAYFAVCSIDLQSLCTDLNIHYDIAESFEENGKVVSEIVIENSKIAGYSYIYVDKNGVMWSGPIHQNDIGEWRSGDDETSTSITLSKITVSNAKIQDFRNFAEIQRVMLDFNQQKRGINGNLATNFNLENTLKQFTKIQSVDYSPENNLSQFTDIFSSLDSDGNVRFLFGAEFINILKTCSKFAKLYDSNNQTFKVESISNTKILNLKLYRRRIKNNILAYSSVAEQNLEKLNESDPDELILQTKDRSWKNFNDLSDQNASIREIELIVSDDNDYVRYFSGVDKTFKNLSDGVYQYYIELELEDGIIELVKQQLQNLSLAKNQLTEYYNKVSKPTMRKFLLESQDPHIDSPRETSNNSLITDYGYDIVSNKLSQQLINRLIREYGGIQSLSAPWINCVSIFAACLDIFSESIQTNDDRRNMINSLYLFLNPNSTNPSIIAKIIELIDYFMSSISRTFDIDLENSYNSSQLSPSSSKTNRSFKITKFFNEVLDTSFLKTYNIDYLSTSANSQNNDDGLKVISINQFSERISNEMLKFFNTQTPSINFSNSGDNSENIKYSYLTPTRLDFANRSVLFSGIENQINASQNRIIEDFYNIGTTYEKAISIYADILNFKLDVNGKNRKRISRPEIQRPNLSQTEKARAQAKETINTSKKINDLFSDFANLTIQRFRTNNSAVLLGNSNIKPLNNLMSSLSSGAIRRRQINNTTRSVTSGNDINKIISHSEYDYVKNLATINVNNIKIITGQVSGFRGTRKFSASKLNKIPNQIRALIFKPQNQLSNNIINNLDYTGNFSTYIKNKTINYFNFEMLTEVQYLSGFQKIRNSDNLNLKSPIWKTLNKEYIDTIPEEKEILCRLKSFQNLDLNIKSSTEIEKRSYDKYFIIKTSRRVQQPVISRDLFTNPFIDNFIQSLRDGLPGIRVTGTSNLTPSLLMIPPSIEITRVDISGNRESINIKDIRDIVTKDINRNTGIKFGKPVTPATAFAASHALSLGIQEVSINNNFRSSNHVPNRNVGRPSPRPNVQQSLNKAMSSR